MAFLKPAQSIEPFIKGDTFSGDRGTPYFEVVYQKWASKPAYDAKEPPLGVVARVRFHGSLAAYLLDSKADSLYTRAKAKIMTGLAGKLTAEEAGLISGLDVLAAAIGDATYTPG